MVLRRLGPYRLIKLVGAGRTAEVHCARHSKTGAFVAIKLLHEFITDQSTKQKFLEEAKIVQRLDHPGIVQIIDANFHENTRPYIVMTYAPGNDLRQKHPSGTCLPLETILSYTKQLADALAYAHQQNIVHCDLKPENVLLGKDDRLLLSDFGIARIRETTLSQTTRDAFGTASYMAPEQFRGKYSPASDQDALATMVYEWLSGHPPFSGKNFNQLMDRHMTMPVPSLREACRVSTKEKEISEEVEHVILKALAKEPHARFSSVLEFAQALEQASIQALEQAAQTDNRVDYTQYPLASTIHSSASIAEEVPIEAQTVPTPPFQSATDPLIQEQRAQRRQQGHRNKLSVIIGAGLAITIVIFSTVVIAVKVFPGTFPNRSMASPIPNQTYPPIGWQLILNDPLMDNSNGYNWATARDSKGSCGFASGAYQVTAVPNNGRLCANDLPNFSNLVFEVQMMIVTGDAGGIILRRDRVSGDQYYFHISHGGTCRFDIQINNAFSKSLYFRTCPAVHSGLNQTNLIAVEAKSNMFSLYVNRQFITSVVDNSFLSGQIGFVANAQDNPTKVLFSNAKVWTPSS